MILIPKYQDITVPEQNIVMPGFRGRFKLTAIRPDGRERPLTDWFDNLVLDSGLNAIGTAGQLNACHVGTSNVAVTAAQTGLQGWLAGTTGVEETNYGAQSSPPYYGWKTKRFRFPQGVATGNISEVGIGPSPNSGTTLWSRALTVNGGGTPTTITVLSDEVLDVTYELRLYSPTVDGSGTFTIGGVSYTVTWRASEVTSATGWGNYLGDATNHNPANTLAAHSVFNGAMGATTAAPSGVSAGVAPVHVAYTNNSLQRDATSSYGLNAGNLAGGIKSVQIHTTLGRFQFEFNNPVPKDNTKTLVLTHRISWARYP